MKSYRLADLLTAIRLVGSLMIPFIVSPVVVFWTFGVLFFTDFLDGVVALRWPDPHKSKRWYNRLPVSFDNIADIALFAGGAVWIVAQEAWVVKDLYVFGALAIIFVVTRIIQDSPRVREPFKTWAATACMWMFGLMILEEIAIIIRATGDFGLWLLVTSISVLVIVKRGKRNINTADKR